METEELDVQQIWLISSMRSRQIRQKKIMNKFKKMSFTPPEPAAIAGAMRTLSFLRTATASGVQGIFDPIVNNQ